MGRELIVIAHDMRSTFNVGSLMRTAEGLGVKKVYLTGYTPYPLQINDNRLPHIAAKLDVQIKKTSLGAEKSLEWEYIEDINKVLSILSRQGFEIAALEQSDKSISLPDFTPSPKLTLLLGTEVTGLPKNILDSIPLHIEIPMQGKKESFNVVIAAAIALYHCRFK
ncbi:MAG: TrmH family RNA methyltransferase [bacterium]|nr:TrmH family RNA methyltransferase [bacterium]